MRFGRFGNWVLAIGLVWSGKDACAQATVPATGLPGEFASLASRAALIFVGQVIRIERRGEAVEITFNVEQPIAGSVDGQYTLREWTGLWPQGQYRYTVGQRALLFLHGASAAGLGSPVDGAEGVVPVVVQGANAPELLDVRRLSAALLRRPGTPLATEATGAIQLAEALPLIAAGLVRGGNRLPRPEPVRLPMPVRVGVAGARTQEPADSRESSPQLPGRNAVKAGVIYGSL